MAAIEVIRHGIERGVVDGVTDPFVHRQDEEHARLGGLHGREGQRPRPGPLAGQFHDQLGPVSFQPKLGVDAEHASRIEQAEIQAALGRPGIEHGEATARHLRPRSARPAVGDGESPIRSLQGHFDGLVGDGQPIGQALGTQFVEAAGPSQREIVGPDGGRLLADEAGQHLGRAGRNDKPGAELMPVIAGAAGCLAEAPVDRLPLGVIEGDAEGYLALPLNADPPRHLVDLPGLNRERTGLLETPIGRAGVLDPHGLAAAVDLFALERGAGLRRSRPATVPAREALLEVAVDDQVLGSQGRLSAEDGC